MSKKLATIRTISKIDSIEGKDRIGLAQVDGWQVIVQKDAFEEGGKCIFIEPGAKLPEIPEFEFLRKKKFKIKTMKMAGVLSQGICFPLSLFPKLSKKPIGADVTDYLNVIDFTEIIEESGKRPNSKSKTLRFKLARFLMKYRLTRWIGRMIAPKKVWAGFPPFLRKTDETRIQNMPGALKRNITYEGREKLDGQSGTFFVRKTSSWWPWAKKYDYGVCSRNLRLHPSENKSQNHISKKYGMGNILSAILGDNEWVAIQGECVGPGVQKNRYKLNEFDIYVFNLIFSSGEVDSKVGEELLGRFGLKWCPLIYEEVRLPDSVQEVLEMSNGKSSIADVPREGIVYRNYEHKISFKAVSPEYLMKIGE